MSHKQPSEVDELMKLFYAITDDQVKTMNEYHVCSFPGCRRIYSRFQVKYWDERLEKHVYIDSQFCPECDKSLIRLLSH